MTNLTNERADMIINQVLGCLTNMSAIDRVGILEICKMNVLTAALPERKATEIKEDILQEARKLRLDKRGY